MSAGFVCYFATQLIKVKLKLDDSLDVFPVHGVGGILGTFLAGIFASAGLGVFSGQGYAEGMNMSSQVTVQLIGIGAHALTGSGEFFHQCGILINDVFQLHDGLIDLLNTGRLLF